MKNTSILACLVAALGGMATAQTPIQVLNADFALGTNFNATDWISTDGGGVNSSPSNYADAVPGSTWGRSMQIKSDGGNYIQLPLTVTQASAAIDASTYGEWSISFKSGYRRDAVLNGDHTLRISLWNTTANTELAGSDITITDPGSTGANSLTLQTKALSYDETNPALVGAALALRVTSNSSDLTSNAWQRTAMFDDISITAGSAVDPILTLAPVLPFPSNGAPATFTLNYSNTGATQNLVVSSVTLGGPDAASFTVISFTTPLAPAAAGQIQLGFTSAGSGTYTAEVTINSNDSTTPSRVVPITVNVVDPVLAASATRLDFGNLAANPGAQTVNLTITNNGGGTDLEITSAAFLGTGGNGFTIVSLPAPIAPGASADIVVGFNPGTTATGHFGDLLRIESNAQNTPVLDVPVLAQVAFTAATTSVAIVNGDFNAADWNSAVGTSPTGWTSSKAATNAAGDYGQTAPQTPNLTSIAAHFVATGGFLEQNLSANNSGLTAAGAGVVSVTFDQSYRNDAVTNGDLLLRVALWDTTNDVEITGRELLIEDSGVQAGAAANQLAPVSFRLNYNPATYTTEQFALRITQLAPQLAVNPWQATAIIDNVTVAVTGTWTGPTDPFTTWALANGLDGTPGKENGKTDDPDHDGATNFSEFAFAGNPLSGGSNGLVAVSTVDTTADIQPELIITLAVRAGASFSGSPSPAASIDGIDYSVQGSLDLSLFTAPVEGPLAAPVIPASLPATSPAGYDYVSFRLAGSNGLPGKGFLRALAAH